MGLKMTMTIETQELHFVDAVQFIIRVILASNSPTYAREIKRKETDSDFIQVSNRLAKDEKKQKKRQRFSQCMAGKTSTDLATAVACMKIQSLFRARLAKRKVEARKNQIAEEQRRN